MSENGNKLNEEQQEQLLFMMLVQQHQQIAMMGLGKIQHPETGQTEKDLSSAKYAIDTLGMLKKFTEGNLSKESANYLDQALTNLRLNYAEEKKKENNAPSGEAPEKEDE
ncbi:MAG: DUF1844 domain-containing protein [Gracilimonas sp.]|uniref:DUF1844 domain-containing protein n=1 Tax=Gracilimonas sediminicola TaxID=2952158 RepID=A0A9X2L3L8_9BACT|nr:MULTISPECIES: DUF1844 domain-containing protein [Gracilimonas]MBO6585303.1 DUF1844 domain-containing protein [Gracilimonas sp.]MBO6616299.1 DUF1844 domain-containing protein [Gracilimonas sp.]MCP9291750.1 DUF1844 domain-containing protein [Gracilimonas sediminicola]